MLLTVTYEGNDATDLGYLLVKHPDRVHRFEVPAGTAIVCFPEATDRRCTAALILDVDPTRLVGDRLGGRRDDVALARYVNDRPYAASSLLAAACKRVFATAMKGASADRPELAAARIPLTLGIPALRCRGGAGLVTALFAPLGWSVDVEEVPLDPAFPEWGASRYVNLTLTGEQRLADALNQVYLLLPVCDDAKHYWVAPDEIDKLLRAGAGWLADHPERELITRRYLAHQRALTAEANHRLDALRAAEDSPAPDTVDSADADRADADGADDEDAELPAPVRRVPLAAQRRDTVRAELERVGAARVLDLGCGPGALLAELARDRRYTELVGVDVSTSALRLAARRLRLDRVPERQQGRITLLQSALTYTDDRLVGYDAAVLMEVVEHLDPPRLPAMARAVFGHARPSTVVITTPNVEYNARYEGLTGLRHHDHRFEWSRAEFTTWCDGVARKYGYAVEHRGVGDRDSELGQPTQLAVFTRGEAK